MSTKDPVFEKSRSIEDLQHLRLMALLEELVRDQGIMRAAQELNVDHRTLTSGLETGRLSRRLRGALEKALLEGGGSPAAEQRQRNDELAGRVEVLEKGVETLGQGLAAVQDEVMALRNEQGQALQRFASRLAKVEGSGGDAEEEEGKPGDGGRTPDRESSGGAQPKRRPKLRREFPELATLEPAGDDQDVFGDAWPLIQEWRGLKETHPSRGRGLEWLRQQQRLLEVELALLEEHGLTLPPETYPLRGLDRGAQVNWRHKALADTGRARKKREILLWPLRVLNLGTWRKQPAEAGDGLPVNFC